MSDRGCTELCDVCSAPATCDPCRRCGADLCNEHSFEGRACHRCVRRARVGIVIGAAAAWPLVIAAAALTDNAGFVIFGALGWVVMFVAGLTWAIRRQRRFDPMVPADREPPTLPRARVIERRTAAQQQSPGLAPRRL